MKRNVFRSIAIILALILLSLSIAACGAGGMGLEAGDQLNGADGNHPNYNAPTDMPSGEAPEGDAESGAPDDEENAPTFIENPFISTAENNVSTFSADVDTASYTYFRKLVNSGYAWEELSKFSSAFRTEEFINYFKYEAATPAEGELFGVSPRILPCPWNSNTVLLSMTLQAPVAVPAAGNNLVFLIDVSGSMMSSDKLGLLKTAFTYLTDQLTERDIVSIVTYSGREEVVLSGCPGSQKETVLQKINALSANGSTHGEAGLRRAYEIAEEYRIEGGNNRIIMASDGDLNVGISSAEELTAFISEKRDAGVYLSVLGFGTGNYRDANMEALADNGNGVYYYIDGASEAERVFGSALLGTLYTVAKDVKLQLTFNPSYVASYRLIGYENRLLDEDDFLDDTKDAGEVGAGHQVTVCYELTLAEGAKTEGSEWMSLAVNYKKPDASVSEAPHLYSIGFENYREVPTEEDLFRVCVIELCMLLHNSKYLPESGFTLASILETLDALDLSAHTDRAEFRTLLHTLQKSGE